MRNACVRFVAVVMFLFGLMGVVQGQETVIRDFVGQTDAMVSETGALANQLVLEAGWSAAGGASVTGNGEYLSSVSIVILSVDAEGHANQGNLDLVKYRLRIYDAPPTTLLGLPALIDRGNYQPANSDWRTTFGNWSFLDQEPPIIYNLLKVTVDVRDAAFRLQSGHEYVVVLVAETGEEIPSVYVALSWSRGGPNAIGTGSDWHHDEQIGFPVLLGDVLFDPDIKNFAYRVVTYTPHRADFDKDGDVDGDDLAVLRSCLSGPAIPRPDSEKCRDADADGDNDVDQSDFGLFQRCWTGQGGRPASDC